MHRSLRTHSARHSLVPLILAAASIAGTGCAKRYRIEGLVTSVDPARGTMTVSHREVPGLMPAMVMPFRLARPADAGRVHPGDRVRFELANSRASKVQVIAIQQDFTPPAAAAALKLGDLVPDFTLTDQTGSAVRLSNFRGRAVAIDFIYTRCPLPDVCPRLSAAFAYAARALRDQPVTLISITVDPQHDTPQVLNEYASRFRADQEQWRFLTGTMDDIREVASRFGLIFWPEENMIAHTVTTAIVDREGRIAALIQGSSFRPQELRDLILTVAGN